MLFYFSCAQSEWNWHHLSGGTVLETSICDSPNPILIKKMLFKTCISKRNFVLTFKKKVIFKWIKLKAYSIQSILWEVYPFSNRWLHRLIKLLVTILNTETWSHLSLVLPTPVHFKRLQYLHMKSVSQE